MGFKKLFNSKKILSLLAVFMLLGTSLLFAQDTESAGAAASPAADAVKDNGLATAGYYILLFLIVCFIIGIFGKILRVFDLTQQIQGKQPINWDNVMGVMCLVFLVAGAYGAYWEFTVQGRMILPDAASEHGVKWDEMFWTTTVLTMIVFVVTQILLFTFLFRYRYNKNRRGHFLPHNNTIEKVWTIAPAIVLTILVIFGFFTWQQITDNVDAKGQPASINVDITGHQFAWELRYPGKDARLGATNYKLVSGSNKLGINFKDKYSYDDLQADTMYLPVRKSVRLNIHAQDVIHSVYIPHFRVQLNAVPGLPTFFKFKPTITTAEMRIKLDKPTFEYEILCNKICGGAHYNMKKIVRVVTEAEYQAWLAQQKPYLTDAIKKDLKFAAEKQEVQSKRLALNN
ncbi:cytochrome c oxidase subunit II [Mucilaginibacter phyllosphaerae]|uniref:Cytochrome c oxidase subunit 2 n=1 Tax=Mucilaginibacter phyllosphaerae TaxID=1812349 RepID=A0A4Y8AFB6_9SPHI|nr:cytochrome c oxidase subunit II [Mucilaginibacter phyllosphaerae]MBB3968955.1 cytochrome c oxidase subunit 2 [Mucilaginibacter phyllosphaerae]TEW67423.1 cytochrome c oxidase subunit II [Mucilaginibacter phyllosphaerae]GGH23341.1 cytochrome c oxidase subunit II [Mucilaginibacter phyllosphaerae]